MKFQGFCIALLGALALASNAVPACKGGQCDERDNSGLLQSRVATDVEENDVEEKDVEEKDEDVEALSAIDLEEYSEEDREIMSAWKFKPELASDSHSNKKGYEVMAQVQRTCKKCAKRCQRRKMKASFKVCDKDKNGQISKAEILGCAFNGDTIDKAKKKYTSPFHKKKKRDDDDEEDDDDEDDFFLEEGVNHENDEDDEEFLGKKRKINVNASSAVLGSIGARKFVKDHDANGDGYVSWAEFWDSRESKTCDRRSLVELNQGIGLLEEERQLLSQRSGVISQGNCISNIAKNVWKAVSSTCERSVNVKDCWKSWKFWTGAFWTCRWKTVTETFTCMVNKLVKVVTAVVQGFADCWRTVVDYVKKKVGGAFMDLIKACSSVDSCLKELLKGPKALWDKIVELAKSGINALLNNGPLGTGIKYVKNVIKKIPPMAREVGGIVVDVGVAIGKFIQGALKAIRELGNINMCATSGYGFWYFSPTDCGAFGKLKEIFKLGNIAKIPSIFLDVVKRFGQCIIKLGMLSLPSPFLDVKVKTWCVPTFLQPVIKGIVGTFRFIMAQIAAGIAGCKGHHAKQPVCILVTDIRKIGDRIKRAFSGAMLLEAAERVGEKLHGDKSQYLQASDDESNVKCSVGDFSFFVAVAGGIGPPPGWRFTHFADSIGIKLQASIGCRNGILFADLALGISASLFIAGLNIKFPTDPYKASFRPLGFSLGFSVGTPSTDIVSWSGSFDLAASVVVAGLLLKIGLGFKVLPEPAWPTGFSVSPKVDKAFLLEEAERQKQLQEAQDAAETTEEKVYATVGVLLQQFRNLDHEQVIKSGFVMSAFEEGSARLSGEASSEGFPIIPKEAALNAGLGVTFCFTCKVSGGQPTEAPPAGANVPAPGNGAGPGYLEASNNGNTIHAAGGSQPGHSLTMHACTRANNYPNCQFVLEPSQTRAGMYYIKAKDRASYIHAHGGTQPGHGLTMHQCHKQNNYPNCQWSLEESTTRAGMYYIRGSDRQSFAHGHGGTHGGARLTMHACYKANNYYNCQWRMYVPPSLGATASNLPLANSWASYGGSYGTATNIVANGMCVVEGLVKHGGWGHIATLPANCRPARRLIFNQNNHAKTARVDVQTNGVISWHAGGADHRWISLSGINFPTGGESNLGLANRWASYGGSYGTASYKVTGELCMVNGLVKHGGWGHVATLPTSCRPKRRLIFNMNNHAKTARVDVQTNGVISWHAGGADHRWISLSGINFPTGGESNLGLANRWASYGGSYGTASYKSGLNGLCAVNGLIKHGGWGHLANLPSDCRPARRLIFNLNNHAKTARVDVLTNGQIHWVTGGRDHSWISLSGIIFQATR